MDLNGENFDSNVFDVQIIIFFAVKAKILIRWKTSIG